MTTPRTLCRPSTALGVIAAAALAGAVLAPLPATATTTGVAADDTLFLTGSTNYVLPAGSDGDAMPVEGVGLDFTTSRDGVLYGTRGRGVEGAPAGLYRVTDDGGTVLVKRGRGLAGISPIGNGDSVVYAQNVCPGGDAARGEGRLVRYDLVTKKTTTIISGLGSLAGVVAEGGGVTAVVAPRELCTGQAQDAETLVRVVGGTPTFLPTFGLREPNDIEVAPDGESYLITDSAYEDLETDTEDMDSGAIWRRPFDDANTEIFARVGFPRGLDVTADGTVYSAGASVNGSYENPLTGIAQQVSADGETVSRVAGTPSQLLDVVADLPPVVDPTITATRTSEKPLNKAGWYRTPVTVDFTCTEGSAPLEGDCPAPVTLRNADRTLERTITATDGGSDTVSVRVRVDTTDPLVEARRVGSAPYEPSARPIRCSAGDELSGLAGDCVVSYGAVQTRDNGTRFRTWTATAKDVAGNVTTVKGSFGVRR